MGAETATYARSCLHAGAEGFADAHVLGEQGAEHGHIQAALDNTGGQECFMRRLCCLQICGMSHGCEELGILDFDDINLHVGKRVFANLTRSNFQGRCSPDPKWRLCCFMQHQVEGNEQNDATVSLRYPQDLIQPQCDLGV